ncbi:cytochrome P450 [Aspergillus uvarum CBS 121591]|uniref:Cytochrome P450 n=1 Tax=Aspergillus uvarum CBS 121591 TaxID=1448315 RepID=A0A319CAV8_9EURO|nr:cytochrome P450 [Aspergillus uvarum CBS 121591]PYH81229.1 cytochrome P450 [Aspergillus uvarum CBS 121591]
MPVTFGNRLGFMESGWQDIDNMMQGLFGNPTTALFAFVQRLTDARNGSRNPRQAKEQEADGMPRTAEDFYRKLEILREKDQAGYESYSSGEALTMSIVGERDTTSNSLTAILFYFAQNRNVYLKLRREVREATLTQPNAPITFDCVQKMQYLQRVMKEGLRMHEATGLPLWRPGSPLQSAGIRDRRNRLSTRRWDPTPTDKEQLKQMEQYFLPFGAGTRTCIGKNISILEITKSSPNS